jgi:SAM-dependent methyltransferase
MAKATWDRGSRTSAEKRGGRSDAQSMRTFWDSRARENAMFFIHNTLDYRRTDEKEFWESGPENLDRTLEPFRRHILPEHRVLEIGCGIGRMTRALASRARHVVGIDVSDEMIQRARVALSDLDNVELIVGNGVDLESVEDSSIDVAYSFIVFQHIPDPRVTCGYIREIGRVLRPGGWSVFQVSEKPELHRPETWRSAEGARTRLARALGKLPRGCLDAQWLGSALGHDQLLEAIADGGLVLDGAVGEGSQFCLVNAHRPLE